MASLPNPSPSPTLPSRADAELPAPLLLLRPGAAAGHAGHCRGQQTCLTPAGHCRCRTRLTRGDSIRTRSDPVRSMAMAAAAQAVTEELPLPLRAVGDVAAAAGVSQE
ncbi:hypothetical protein ZWY2020_039848 [Hordeum vulgare]|nr:hypothetical protein ZWY2020_039848 [Hordeum vulgare]